MRKKAVFTACSDPLSADRVQEIRVLKERLCEEGLEAEIISGFFESRLPDPVRKAQLLTDCFRDDNVNYIFDVSGGELANLVLPYIDYEVVRNSRALFYGYSDLSTVINAIIAKTGRAAVNYQIRNLLYDHGREQIRYFRESILADHIVPDDLEIEFLRGRQLAGRILGGNTRCFLKLAGTEYWPDMEGSILLLESYGGGVFQMMTALEQYRQTGVFNRVNGVLLGTFSKMEKEHFTPTIEELVLSMVPDNMPVARTRYIGHHTDARAIVLGKECCISA